MFQINKYFRLSRNFPRRGNFRNICVDNYECKSPPVPDVWEEYIEGLKEFRKPVIVTRNTCGAEKHMKLFRGLFLFVCVPGLLGEFLNYYYFKEEKRKRLKFVEFEYLRIRNKPFVWDPVRTLFHNPRYNALPTGYEFEVPEDEEIDPFDLWRW